MKIICLHYSYLLLQAHTGPVTHLTYSPGCVVTLGEDDKLCVWERHQVRQHMLRLMIMT